MTQSSFITACMLHMEKAAELREQAAKIRLQLEEVMQAERKQFLLAKAMIDYLENSDDGKVPTSVYAEFNRLNDEGIDL